MEQVGRLLAKLKIELPYDSAILLLGMYLDLETIIQKDTCTPVFTEALFKIAKTWKCPKCVSTDNLVKIFIQWNATQLQKGMK